MDFIEAAILLRVLSKLKDSSFAPVLFNYVKARRNWKFGLVGVKTFLGLIGPSSMIKVWVSMLGSRPEKQRLVGLYQGLGDE